MIEVKKVNIDNKASLKEFIAFAWEVYKDDPNWVPPLWIDMYGKFNKKKNPFLYHSEIQPFLAYKDGVPSGRIVAILNNAHNSVFDEKTGFFGFFESFNDKEVSRALLETAMHWLKNKGMELMRGPANFSSNDDWGALIDSYDQPPMILMPYNPDYYLDLFKDSGLTKTKDVYAYKMDTSHIFPDRISKIIEYVKNKQRVTIRNLDMKKYDNELQVLKDIYNSAWEQNWGFIPMTDEEMEHMAKELKAIVDPRFVFFAYVDEKPIGISACIPNINEILINIKNGKLLPTGIFKLMMNMKKIKSGRLLILGLVEEYRNKGIEPLFFQETLSAAKNAGWAWGEMSWILEDNMLMRSSIEKAGGQIYKTYRIFDKALV